MTNVKGMSAPSGTPTPHVTVVDQLRGPDLTVACFEPAEARPVRPVPAKPKRRLTAEPLAPGLYEDGFRPAAWDAFGKSPTQRTAV